MPAKVDWKLPLILLLLCGSTNAHHSFVVHFDPEDLMSISGTVTDYRFRNPHALIRINLNDSTQTWTAETNSPSRLRRRGWSADTVEPGDRVTIEGYRARDGSNYMRLHRLIHPDGEVLIGHTVAEDADGE
ncbi:MAG: DUF6152 family protein [Rhodospirillaceae bacterium]|nr:DUF6152 family protein [Rhodospirillaceae bacterium]